MKLQFKEQQFQIDAVKAVVDSFEGQPQKTNRFTLERRKEIIRRTKQSTIVANEIFEEIGYRNSPIQMPELQVLENIKKIQQQNEIYESKRIECPAGTNTGYNLTIEMETGTGKTYTYIRTMYELHKKYGWSKFIVIVPSIAIREEVYKSFEVTQDHFQELYGHKIVPFIYNSGRPQDIENFASDNRISVMIINNIVYHKIDDNYDAKTVFTNDNTVLRDAISLKKHIYDYLTSDSRIETEFAKELDRAVEVVVYAKLPKSFYVTTPVERYSPD